ncbi:MAG TPA: short-chain dehydrogenase/reductase [Xanthobacteraceae bacterium]|nr:short-chain dehydrogenase/reductase [Xanthobacteraceae bacterium]
MDLGLAGKRALVTGASKGIGLAIAQALAAEGCHLAIAGRTRATLDAAADALGKAAPRIDVRVHVADLGLVADQERLAASCADADILVNNAGAAAAGSLDETTDAGWRASWDLKVFGYINLARAFYQAMKARRGGVILNVIGYAGERHNAKYVIGSTGNAALMAFTRTAGSESPDFGVRILGINPGYTATGRAEAQLRSFAEKKFGDAARWREIEQEFNLPFGRMAKPQEIADAAAFLVSPRAGYVSGTVVTIDGGATHRNF